MNLFRSVSCRWVGLTVLSLVPFAPGVRAADEAADSGLRVTGVESSGEGRVGLFLEYPEALAGTVWDVYSCDAAEEGGAVSTWRLAESDLVLAAGGRQVWVDSGQGERAPVADCPVRLYLVRQRVGEAEVAPQMLVFRTTSEPVLGASGYRVEVSTLNPEEVAALFATGFDASQGFVAGALHEQGGWMTTGDVLVDPTQPHAGDHSVRLRGDHARMRRFVTVEGDVVRIEMSVYVSSTGGVQRAEAPLPPRVSASMAFHPGIGFYAFDGDGAGGGRWIVVPDSRHVDQWVRVGVENNYATKKWSITVQDGEPLTGLGFRNNELERLEEINFYAGNNREMLVDSIVIEGK